MTTDPFEDKPGAEADRRAQQQLASALHELRSRVTKVERSNQMSRGSIIDQPLDVYDTSENLGMQVGEQYDGSIIANPLVGPEPPIPTAPTLRPGLRSVTVYWDGQWEAWYDEDDEILDDQVVAPLDFARVEIHASTDPDFEPSTIATLVGTFETPRGGETLVPIPTTGEDYTIKLVARTTTGKRGDASDGATVQADEVASSDGFPPAASPTPVAIAQQSGVYLAWEGVDNADPVTYSIYANDVLPVPIDTAHRIADVDATAFLATVWRYNPSVERIPYDSDTYFRIVASDADGSAAPGPAVAARAQRMDADDLNDGIVSLAKLGTDASDAIANASSSAAAAVDTADDALTVAQAAQATADGSIRTYYASTPPWANGSAQPDSVLGDMWFDQDDGQAYRWNGANWQVIEDSSIAAALAAAQNAQTTADGKIDAYYQTSAPLTGALGDLWYDTDAGNKAYYCSSTAPLTWTAIPPGLAALGPDVTARALGAIFTYYQPDAPALGTTREGDLWVDTNDGNRLYRRTATAWEASDDARLQQALTAAATAQTTADGKIRLFAQNEAPTGLLAGDVGDLWIDTNDGNRLWRWSGTAWTDARDTTIAAANAAAITAQNDADAALVAAQDAAARADGKVAAYFQTTAPTGLTAADAGDLWYDTDDGNHLWRWNGTAWIDARDAAIQGAIAAASAAQARADEAIADAADAQATADGKTRTYFQTAAPTGLTATDVGDMWFDTDDGNKMHRWSGSAWVVSDDQRIAQAITAAGNAQTTANSKITTYYQPGIPVATAVGDLWVNTADSNRLYRAASVGADQIAAGEWIDVRDAAISSAAAAASAAQTAAANALTAAQAAQATADNAIRTYYQAAAPTGLNNTTDVGDMWFDTDDGQAYRWTGAAWAVIEDSSIAAALAAAQNAQTTADGKITAYYQAAPPWANGAGGHATDTGDLWYDTDDKNRPYYWNGTTSTWVEIRDQTIIDAANAAAAAQTTANTAAANATAAQQDADQALADAADAQATADGKVRTFFVTAAPTGLTAGDVGDLWFDTDDAYKMYRWDGTGWVLSADTRISQALQDAANANTAAGNASTAAAAAQQAADNALIEGTYALNPFFDNWPVGQALPTSWGALSGSAPVRETALVRTAPTAVRWNLAAATQAYFSQAINTIQNSQYVAVTLDFQLVSGTLAGAGALVRWRNTVPANFDATISLATEVPAPDLGKWYRVTKIVQRPAGFTGTYAGMDLFVMGGYTPLAAITAKNIIFDGAAIRPATTAEVQAFNAATAASVTSLTTTVGTKITTFYQPGIPTSTAIGDLWVDTDDGNRLYRAAAVGATTIAAGGWVDVRDTSIAAAAAAASSANTAAGNALTAAQTAQATADGAVRTYYQTTAPWANGSTQPAAALGDLWFRTSDNHSFRWDGTNWVEILDPNINAALLAAQNAQTTADGRITAYYQAAAPWANGTAGHANDVGDLWYDTDDGNKPYYWASNNTWTLVQDAAIATAQQTANSRVTTFYQTGPPTSLAVGDLWIDTDDQNRMYRSAVAGSAVVGAGGWVDVRDASISAASASAAAAVTTANNAMTAAQTAQATADGAIRTYYQSAAPWANGATGHANDAGDMWFDTDDGQAYRWDDTTKVWVTIEDNSIAAALAAAQNAQTTADGKITSYFGANPPWADGAAGHANDVGDLWYETDAGNKTWYWTGTAWAALPTGLGGLAADVTARNLGAITTYTGTTAPTGVITGDMWLHGPQTLNGVANKYVLKRWSGSAWVEVSDAKVEQAIASATSAANLADAKMRIFYEAKHATLFVPASNPTMVATDVGDLWFRTDEGNRPYRWTGSVWSAFTFGAAGLAASDGIVPSTSPTPTVTPGIRSVFLRWTAISNRDPVTYRVYGAKTATFTPDVSNFIGETSGTAMTVNVLPGTPTTSFDPNITPTEPAYFKIIAADADGPSTVISGVGSGAARQIDGGDLGFESVTADHIGVGEIVGSLFSGEIVLGSTISTGSIDDDPASPTYQQVVGQRIEMGPSGLDVIDAAGDAFIHFPTSSTDTAFVRARLETGELRVLGGASFESKTSEIAKDAGLTLSAGVTPPVSSPWLLSEYDRIQLQRVSTGPQDPAFGNLGTFALQYSRIVCVGWNVGLGCWIVAEKVSGGIRLWHYNADGTVSPTFSGKLWVDDIEGWSDITGLWGYAGDITTGFFGKYGGDWVISGKAGAAGGGAMQNNRLGNVQNDALKPCATFDPISGYHMLLENNVDQNPGRAARVRAMTISNTFWDTMTQVTTYTSSTSGVSNGSQPLGFMRGNYDLGVTRYVWGWQNSQSSVMVSAVTGGAGPDTQNRFVPATPLIGLGWDGSNFWSFGSDGYMYKHTAWKWTDGLDYVHAGITWYDSDTAGTPVPPAVNGVHETSLGNIATVALRKRAKLRVILPIVPDKGGVDDPDKWRLYMLRSGAAKPAATSMIYQTEGGSPTAAVALIMESLGTADVKRPPAFPGNFPGATPGWFKSAKFSPLDPARENFYVDGNGRGRWDEVAPPGSVQMYAGNAVVPGYVAPEIAPGWLLCRGDVVARAAYPALFAVIGTTFNQGGEASTDFRLPDMMRRVPVGWASNLPVGASDNIAIGSATTRSPLHAHTIPDHSHFKGTLDTDNDNASSTTQNGTNTNRANASHRHTVSGQTGVVVGANPGSGSAGPDYLTLNYIIKY